MGYGGIKLPFEILPEWTCLGGSGIVMPPPLVLSSGYGMGVLGGTGGGTVEPKVSVLRRGELCCCELGLLELDLLNSWL